MWKECRKSKGHFSRILIGGYIFIIEKILEGAEIRLNEDYLANKAELDALAEKVIYNGQIDAFFGYSLGELESRSVRFETDTLDTENYQGNTVVIYTDRKTPFTRIIEHKHFEFGTQPKTVIHNPKEHIIHPDGVFSGIMGN